LGCTCCPGNAPLPVLIGLHAVPPVPRKSKSMATEYLHGRPLSPNDLEMIRQQIEEDHLVDVDDEIRGIVGRNRPQLRS
jgi:hypothetical protein